MRCAWAVLLGLAAVAAPAAACSPPPVDLVDSMPADGATWPGNASVALLGWGMTFDGLSATVDGAPARLVPTPALDFVAWPGEGYSDPTPWTTARVDPPPTPGAAVVVTGNPCSDDGFVEGPCALQLAYTAGPPDLEAPPAPGGLWFDLYAHGPVEVYPGECDAWGDSEWRVHFTAGSDAGPGAAVLRLEATGTPARPLHTEPLAAGAGDRIVEGRIEHGADGAPLPEALCLRAVAYDLAGNSAASAEVCKPCHFIADEQPREHAPPVPAFGPDDLWPGGVCAGNAAPAPDGGVDATPDGGADASPDGGPVEAPMPGDGGCDVAGSTPGPAFLLLALAFVPRRRR